MYLFESIIVIDYVSQSIFIKARNCLIYQFGKLYLLYEKCVAARGLCCAKHTKRKHEERTCITLASDLFTIQVYTWKYKAIITNSSKCAKIIMVQKRNLRVLE